MLKHLLLARFLGVAIGAVAEEKKAPLPDDQYAPHPDSREQPGVPKGEVAKYSWNESKIFPDAMRWIWRDFPK